MALVRTMDRIKKGNMDGISVVIHKITPSRAAENPVRLSRIKARSPRLDRMDGVHLRFIGNTSGDSMQRLEI